MDPQVSLLHVESTSPSTSVYEIRLNTQRIGELTLNVVRSEGWAWIYDIQLDDEMYEKRLGKGFSAYVRIGELCMEKGHPLHSFVRESNAERVWKKLVSAGLARKDGNSYYYTGITE